MRTWGKVRPKQFFSTLGSFAQLKNIIYIYIECVRYWYNWSTGGGRNVRDTDLAGPPVVQVICEILLKPALCWWQEFVRYWYSQLFPEYLTIFRSISLDKESQLRQVNLSRYHTSMAKVASRRWRLEGPTAPDGDTWGFKFVTVSD